MDGLPIDNRTFNQGALVSNQSNRANDYQNRAGDINPADIESVTVLKGPEAAALYGIDAFASGDILPFTNDIEFVVLPASMDESMQKTWREVSAQFAISYANEWWIVYQRKIAG